MGWQMQPTSQAGREATCTNQPMAEAVWAGQTASSVAETEERRIAVSKDGAKRPGSEGAARLSRRQGPLADWNRLSIEYP